MSTNHIVTKGHHTCRKCQKAYAIAHAPFKSCYDKQTKNEPYLGDGYYFWDDNLPLAEWWGRCHYQDSYTILEYDLDLFGDHFLDLVGSRQDFMYFQALVDRIRQQPDCENFGVYKCIDLLLKIERSKQGTFPIRIIRAMDISHINGIQFANNKRGRMLLDPRIIICFLIKRIYLYNLQRLLDNVYLSDYEKLETIIGFA